MNYDPIMVASLKDTITMLTNGHADRPRVIFPEQANGSRIVFASASSSDNADNVIGLLAVEALTLQSAMGTGAHVDGGGSSDTITRSAGDFLGDGWRVGDRLLVQGSTTLANDFMTVLTAVASGTLTFATNTVNTAENLPAGAKLYRAAYLGSVPILTNSGIPAATPKKSVNLLDPNYIPSILSHPDTFLPCAPAHGLAAHVLNALGSGELVGIVVKSGNF